VSAILLPGRTAFQNWPRSADAGTPFRGTRERWRVTLAISHAHFRRLSRLHVRLRHVLREPLGDATGYALLRSVPARRIMSIRVNFWTSHCPKNPIGYRDEETGVKGLATLPALPQNGQGGDGHLTDTLKGLLRRVLRLSR
jgi:hypothetical protein